MKQDMMTTKNNTDFLELILYYLAEQSPIKIKQLLNLPINQIIV